MSALATFSRTRPNVVIPTFSGALSSSQVILVQKRTRTFLPSKKDDKKTKNLKAAVAHGNPLQAPSRSKRPPSFYPLSATQLGHSAFESATRASLSLPTFHPEFLSQNALGKAVAFTSGKDSVIKAYGLPRRLLFEFRILSKPCSVVRDVTLSTIDRLDAAKKSPSNETRAVITGPTGSGKSFLLLQATQYCAESDWITLYIPRAIKLVDSSTQYIYDARTRTYIQPVYSYEVLRRFQQMNQAAFEQLKTSRDIEITTRRISPAGSSLLDLVHMGMRQQSDAPAVLSALLSELALQTKYPVLLAIDDFQALYCQTKYRDPRFMGIKPYHLSLPRLLLEYASGKKSFARGAVVGAISTTNVAFQAPLELKEALGLHDNVPAGPYARRQAELIDYTKGLQNIAIPAQMKINEAASLYEVWHKDRALHEPHPSDSAFMRVYAESSGNPREFVWKGMLSSFST